ncbi:dolichyl-phosphate beta-glucosyltransferase [Streptomyces sp. NPDC051211]|uniref:dolichyl-phosphate beta-glucosyltransferase n=1 Tax=Streptomyces sp. NPDC051211 TaxID=3154643 RepID=UPI0034502DA2
MTGAPAPQAWLGPVELSVIVPAYREEKRLGPTLDALRTYLDTHRGTAPGDWEVVVVDDGSTDGTAAVAAAAAAAEPRIRLIRSDRNRGKGGALRLGVLASTGQRVLLTDADLATPVEELEHLEKALDGDPGLQAAIGSRAHPDSSIERRQGRLREVLGRAGNRLIRAVAVPGIRDTQCGFKLFDGDRARAAFAASRLDGWGVDVEILQYFRRQGWSVAEVPVRWAHQEGSKVRPLDYLRVLGELARLNAGALAVAALYLLAALFLYRHRWADLQGTYLADSGQDQNQWEWFFAVTADNLSHLRNPLFTRLQGMPDGVNLMGNTVMLGLSVPLAPLTLLAGPEFTLALVFTLGIAGTAWAWYRLIRRWLVAGRWAAAAGGALAAFAPPMVSHANAHPNFVVLFMLPVIIDRALRLCAGRRVVRDGVLLGLFSAYQVFLGEEPFLLAALGMLVFAGAYALFDRERARVAWKPLVKGLAIAAAVSVPLVAFPLYWQFFGPQSYHSVLHGDSAGNSPRALIEYASQSFFGDRPTAERLSLNPTEQNAFFGWPLLALAAGIVVWLWRYTAVRALAVTCAAAALLSLGSRIRIPHTEIVVPGPWRALAHQPLFESVIEGRVAMVCAPVLGMLLALGLDRIRRLRAREQRVLGGLAVAAALIPVLPVPLEVRDREPVPVFIAEGLWKPYVKEGEALVPVPLPDPGAADALHWQVEADFGFRLAGGYFNGPWGPERIGIYGAAPRHLSNLLRDIRYGAEPPVITPEWQAQARADLEYWKAGAVVLPVQDRALELRGTLTALLGKPPVKEADVWVWRVGKG